MSLALFSQLYSKECSRGKKKKPPSNSDSVVAEQSTATVQPEYLPPPFSIMRHLAISKEAIQGADSAFALIKEDYPEIRSLINRASVNSINPSESSSKSSESDGQCVNSKDDHVYLLLQDAAHSYWHGHQIYKQTLMPNYEIDLEKIQKSIITLRATLASTPLAVRGLLNQHLRFTSSDSSLTLTKFDESLNNLGEAIGKAASQASRKEIEERPPAGPRPKQHLQKLVAEISGIWCGAEKKFERRFDKGRGRDSEPGVRFISEGVEFVCKVARAIDPGLTEGQVITALKKLTRVKSS